MSDYIQKVKDKWSPLEVFKHFNFDRDGIEKNGKETRLLGHGGLFVNGQTWHTFADDLGGGSVEAWYFCKHSKAIPQGEFWSIITEMGDVAGIERPEMSDEAKAAHDERRALEEVFNLAADFYHEQLPEEQRDWLHTRYGLTDDTIDALKLGYATTGKIDLYSYLMKVHKCKKDFLLKTGLFRQHDDGSIEDAFQGRLMFPYWNRGSVVYFIGRETDLTPQWEKDRGMKYAKQLVHNEKHPSVSEEVRNDWFYGEDAVRGQDTIFITEGVTDCIIANQHGFPCVSPVTVAFRDADHSKFIELTKRAQTIYIINDNEKNEAGRKGALRTAGALWGTGKQARFVELPKPEGLDKIDLNDFLRQYGADEFKKLLPSAKTLLDIYVEMACKADFGEAKANALHDVFRLIAQIENGFLRSQWRKDLSKKLEISKGDYDDFIESATADLEREQSQKAQEEQQDVIADLSGIQVNNRQLNEITDDALAALKDYSESSAAFPSIYVRGGMLVRVVADENQQRTVQLVRDGSLRKILSDATCWYVVSKDENEKVSTSNVFPPEAVVKGMLQLGEWPGIPALENIVNTPVFGQDGTLHTNPGYNDQTRLFYTGGVNLGDTTPTPENVARAKSLISDDLLLDFPFKDESSKTHAIAYLLLPFARPMIQGPTPLYLFNSPTPGTGKGKCINACAFPSLGYDVPTMTEAQNDDEWRKRITTVLMNGRSHVVIDNVNNGLNSGDLASALTQPVWSDRMLGGNQEVNVRIKTVWAASGNNIPVSEELARRCVLIQLDANVEKPWERTGFKHADLMSWARANRDELVTAAITLINAWMAAGKPAFKGKIKGSYEAWANAMGGILQTVGINGFLENESTMFEAAVSKTQVLADFVKEWANTYQDKSTSAHDLFKLASHADSDAEQALGGYSGLLDEILGSGNQRSRQTKLGKILAENKDKVIAGYKIVFDSVTRGQKYHSLKKSGERSPEVHHAESTILPQENDGNTKKCGERGEPHIPYIARVEEKNKSSFSEKENIIFSSDVAGDGVADVHHVHHVHHVSQQEREQQVRNLPQLRGLLNILMITGTLEEKKAAGVLSSWLHCQDVDKSAAASAVHVLGLNQEFSVDFWAAL